jgi:hypothetical protein
MAIRGNSFQFVVKRAQDMTSILESEDRLRFAAAARLCGVDISTLHRWRSRGLGGHKLPTFRIGGKRYVLRSALETFLRILNGSHRPETIAEPSSESRMGYLHGEEGGGNSDQLKTPTGSA